MHQRKIIFIKTIKLNLIKKKRYKIYVLHNLQFVQVLFTSSFKSTFLIALLNEPSDGECLMCGCILFQSVGPRYLSECFPNVTVLNLGTVNSLTLKLYTALIII